MSAARYAIPRGTPERRCSSCNAPIFWIVTPAGKSCPVDPDGLTHFASCPNASSHSNKTSGRDKPGNDRSQSGSMSSDDQGDSAGSSFRLAPAREPEEAGTVSLRELWALPLEEQQRLRKHERWDHLREIQLKKENAAPDFPKCAGYYLLEEQRTGRTIVVDPARPWNDARVFAHESRDEAKRWCFAHALIEAQLTPEGLAMVERGELKEGDVVYVRLNTKAEVGGFNLPSWDDESPLQLRGTA